MPKEQRLSRADFVRIRDARFRREHGALFSLSFGVLDEGALAPKLACVVSKKTAARAVDRNLIKRRCRAAARECLQSAATPLVFIFTAKRAAKDASYADIKKEVAELLARAA